MLHCRCFIASLLAAALTSACSGGGDGGGGPIEPPAVVRIDLSVSDTTLTLGRPLRVKATVHASDGDTLPSSRVVWSVTTPGVLDGGTGGEFATAAEGTTTIVATLEGKEARAQVRVVTIRDMALSPGMACALRTDGRVFCWGMHTPVPVAVATPVSFASISVGDGRGCGVTEAGEAHCWTPTPARRVGGNASYRQVASELWRTCGLRADGRVVCWGHAPSSPDTLPAEIRGGVAFRTISAGYYLSCGVTTTDELYCWSTDGEARPALPGVAVRDVRAMANTFCVVSTAGEALCGDPVPKADLQGAGYVYEQVATTGFGTACGRQADGRVLCWGGASGSLAAVPLDTPLRFRSLHLGGGDRVCGVSAAGRAYCMGDNRFGELGDGTTINRATPSEVIVP